MKILILGGTVFLGRHIVDAALKRGHELTLFNRGRHNPDLFPEVERLLGDRDGGLDVLKERSWDAVIDTCGYVPRVVRASAEFLADSVGHYVFISTLSVYKDLGVKGLNESSPVGKLEDETLEEITGATYGPLKALCEQTVEEVYPGRSFIPRPGLIVGPHDPTDRFTYWPVRIADGGMILAPEPREMNVMFIDVRDLSEWIIRMVENGKQGIYNANGPGDPVSMGEFLETCREATGSKGKLVWIDSDFLLKQDVAPWVDLPLWLPGDETAGMGAFDITKALGAGLTFRMLEDTIQDTLNWFRAVRADELHTGMNEERKSRLLKLWSTTR